MSSPIGRLIDGRLLLDAGPSEAGFSRLAAFKRCPQMYAYKHLLGLELEDAAPLIKGSLIHVGLAHIYKRFALSAQGGNSGPGPASYHDWPDAVRLLAEDFERGAPGRPRREALKWVPLVQQTLAHYLAAHGHETPQVLLVEEQIRVGLRWAAGSRRVAEVRLLERGQSVQDPPGSGAPSALGARGAPGASPWRLYTQRLDLVTEAKGANGALILEVVDHKSTSYLKAGHDGTAETYSMHGQFWGAELLARLRFPNHPVVRVYANLVEWPKERRGDAPGSKPGQLQRARITPAPWMLSSFWEDVLDWYDQRDQLVAETTGQGEGPGGFSRDLPSRARDAWSWPKAGLDTACRTFYGPCAYRELCRHGKSRLARLELEMGFRVPEKEKG